MTRALEVEDLQVEFRLRAATVRAVDGVSFTVDEGECLGLVGESGCGKTTTGLSIMRLLPGGGRIAAGSIRVAGTELTTLNDRAMRRLRGKAVGMVYQEPMTSLNPTMTIGEQVAEPLRLHLGLSRTAARSRTLDVLDLVRLPHPRERLDSYPHELSGGLRQRVMIAIALACEPTVLLADEPTTALDVTIQAQILDLLDDLRTSLRMAVVLITHDMGVIAGHTDRVAVMYAGRIVEVAETATLFSKMRHPYTRALLQSIPRLDHDPEQPLASIQGLPPSLAEPMVGCRFRPRCSFATKVCELEDPILTGGTEHLAACFHPVDGPGIVATSPPQKQRSARRAPDVTEGERLLVVEELVKEFPLGGGGGLHGGVRRSVTAVSGVSLTVRAGETFGLVGESGCGKTTFGRLIVGLQKPTSGVIRFGDEDVTALRGSRLRTSRRYRQLMFQDPFASLDPRMRVEATLREPLAIQSFGTRVDRNKRIRELLSEVGLPERALDLYPHELSGGQRQRVGLARALMLNPRLLVADEPVSALDVSIQAQVLNLMKALRERHALTSVVISHDLAVIRFLADRIGVMYLGEIVEIGRAADIYERPAHPYTRGLLDAIPRPAPAEARRHRKLTIKGELPSAVTPPSGCRFHTRCPRAQEICTEVTPKFSSFGEEHEATCHFPLLPAVVDRTDSSYAAQT